MSAWRRETLGLLPEFRVLINKSTGPMALWIELGFCFGDAFTSNNLAVVQRILRFASWCNSRDSGPLPNDTSTAVICAFYEHLPTRREYWPHMRKWFTSNDFIELMPMFAYHLSSEELVELQKAYR